MADLRADFESFALFVNQPIAVGTSAESLDELLMQWQDERDRESINAAIRRGLDDVANGRYRPA